MQTIQIVMADDHDLIIEGVKTVLQESPEFCFVGEANNGKQLLLLLEKVQPDVILMDIDMPEMDGIEAGEIIKKKYPDVSIIALTVHNELGIIKKVRENKLDGYLLKNVEKEELIKAIRTVASGIKYFNANVLDSVLNQIEKNPGREYSAKLTSREIEILKLITDGYSNTEIGKKLFISHRTVDTHRTNLMKKLNVNNIAGLIKFALQHDLLD